MDAIRIYHADDVRRCYNFFDASLAPQDMYRVIDILNQGGIQDIFAFGPTPTDRLYFAFTRHNYNRDELSYWHKPSISYFNGLNNGGRCFRKKMRIVFANITLPQIQKYKIDNKIDW